MHVLLTLVIRGRIIFVSKNITKGEQELKMVVDFAVSLNTVHHWSCNLLCTGTVQKVSVLTFYP